MSDDTYVTNAAWLRPVGRPDLVDDVADQFERPGPVVATEQEVAWPRRSRGWRSMERTHPRPLERRAG
jgi:hypothetical protein